MTGKSVFLEEERITSVKFFTLTALFIFVYFSGSILPGFVTVVIGIAGLFLLIYNKVDQVILYSFIMLVAALTSSIPFNDTLLVIILITVYLTFNKISISKFAFFIISLAIFYLFLTTVYSMFNNVDMLYFEYFKRNIYKEFVLPVFLIILFSIIKLDARGFLKTSFFVGCVISAGQMFSYFLFGVSELTYTSAQITISTLLLLFYKDIKIKLICGFNIFLYIYLTIKGVIYFSSQDVMLIFIMAILYIFFTNKKLFLSLFLLFCILQVLGFNFDIYAYLKNDIGLEPGVAFKLSQIFIVLKSLDLSMIPWSPRVRLVELINTFDRDFFQIVFGSGYVSYITEQTVHFVQNFGEALGPDDFSAEEIHLGVFYGLHNTSRGFLHYGFVYFLIATFLFLKSIKSYNKHNYCQLTLLSSIYAFSMALWNPNIIFLYLLGSIEFCNRKYPVKSRRENEIIKVY